MTDDTQTTTNPRKLHSSGGMTVVSIPTDFLSEVDLERGDRVQLRKTDTGFEAVQVTFTTDT